MSPSTDTAAWAAQEAVVRLFEQVPALVGTDVDLQRRGRHFTCDFQIVVGSQALIVSVAEGRVREVARGPFLMRSSAFSVSAAPETWMRLLQPFPEAGFHDVLALSKSGRVVISGNLQPFMANLQVVKDIITAPRALTAKGQPS
jgi:hypothetical protein